MTKIDPDMPTQQLLLHFGELTPSEVRVARAAIRFANSAQANQPSADYNAGFLAGIDAELVEEYTADGVTRSNSDLFHFENGKHADIVERLRGKVRVPINDGCGPIDGKIDSNFFERNFPATNAANEAADYIEKLRTALCGSQCEVESLHEQAAGESL